MSETIAPAPEALDQDCVENDSWDNEGGALGGTDLDLQGALLTARAKRRNAATGHRLDATEREQTLWSQA